MVKGTDMASLTLEFWEWLDVVGVLRTSQNPVAETLASQLQAQIKEHFEREAQ